MRYLKACVIRRVVLSIFTCCVLVALVKTDESLQYENSTEFGSVSYRSVNDLPILLLHNVILDRETNVISASGADPFFVLKKQFSPPVRYGKLSLAPLSRDQYGFEIYYQSEAGKAFDEKHKVEGVPVESASRTAIDWSLPEPAILLRFDLPERSQFIFQRLDLDQNVQLVGRIANTTGALAGFLLVLVLTVVLLFWIFKLSVRRRTVITVVGGILGIAFLVVTFLLPPMQGPDESQHWKFAVYFYRLPGAHETATYNLNEIIGADDLKFHPDRKLSPEKLLYSVIPLKGSPSLPSFRDYGYVHYFSYPFVCMSSIFFPWVDTVRDALLFYYLSKLLPIIALFALFRYVNARYLVPYTALFFLSLPLVMQQFTVISPDVLQNIGTIAAVVLFLELQRAHRPWLYVLLWGLCLTITYSKIILGGVLLLPSYLMYMRSTLTKRSLFIGAICLAPLPVCAASYLVWLMMLKVGGVNTPSVMRQQVEFLSTAHGFATFGRAYVDALINLCDYRVWSGPLGWLDTRLNPFHLRLIGLSGMLAVTLDVWSFDGQLPFIWSQKRGLFGAVTLIIVISFVFATLSDSLIYYILCTPLHQAAITGLQVRHFFPPMILALFLPLAVTTDAGTGSGASGGQNWLGAVVNIVSMVVMGVLLFARTLQLMIDLLVRYWG